MTRFTKTETALLKEARSNRYGLVGVDHGVDRGRRFGVRRAKAVGSLLDKGLLTRTFSDDGTPLFTPGRGQTGVVYSSTWKLTETL